jgi:hypothetical protein
MEASAATALIGAEQAAFICGGVGVSAATCRPGALPNMARATGCRVSADRRVVTLLVAATPGAAALDDVRRTGAIAVVFTQPSTHRTLQLKGNDARIVPLERGDLDLVERYVRAFAADVAPFGFSAAYMRALLACPTDDLVAVQFTIAAAFSQTPGPRAGEPLAPGA